MNESRRLKPNETSLFRRVFLARVDHGASVEAAERQAFHAVERWGNVGALDDNRIDTRDAEIARLRAGVEAVREVLRRVRFNPDSTAAALAVALDINLGEFVAGRMDARALLERFYDSELESNAPPPGGPSLGDDGAFVLKEIVCYLLDPRNGTDLNNPNERAALADRIQQLVDGQWSAVGFSTTLRMLSTTEAPPNKPSPAAEMIDASIGPVGIAALRALGLWFESSDREPKFSGVPMSNLILNVVQGTMSVEKFVNLLH